MSGARALELDEHPRLRIALLVSILLLGVWARVQGIGDQPPVRDETLSAFTAENYVEHGQFGPTMPFHPNLRNLVLYASTRALGTGAWGLRGPSMLLGVLTLPLLGFLVRRLTRSRAAGWVAMLFLAVDPVHVTFSRQSIQEVHTTFFFVLGACLFVRSLDDRWIPRAGALLPAAGLAFGLAVASKHHGLFPLLVCLGWALYAAWRQRDGRLATLSAISLMVVPATVYLLTYYPWFRRGYDLAEWFTMQSDLLREMIAHQGYATSSAVDTRPWQWFVKPLMGYGNFARSAGRPFVTIAMANPLVWLLVLPASVWLLRKRRGDGGVHLLQILFWTAWLPLALTPRPIWLLSSLAVTPFAFGLVARAFTDLAPSVRRRWLIAFLAAVVAVGALLYPMSIGRALDFAYLRPLVARFAPHP